MCQAAFGNHPKMIELLALSGASVDSLARSSTTPLHWAAALGHAEAVRALLKAGASSSCKTKKKETALQLAVQQGNVAVARLLGGDKGAKQASCQLSKRAAPGEGGARGADAEVSRSAV